MASRCRWSGRTEVPGNDGSAASSEIAGCGAVTAPTDPKDTREGCEWELWKSDEDVQTMCYSLDLEQMLSPDCVHAHYYQANPIVGCLTPRVIASASPGQLCQKSQSQKTCPKAMCTAKRCPVYL